MRDKKKKEPLFYIQQPNIQFPMANMQNTYSSKKAAKQQQKNILISDVETKTDHPANEKRTKAYLETGDTIEMNSPNEISEDKSAELDKREIQETIEKFESKKGAASFSFKAEKKPAAFQRLKGFKEMDLNERIDYLIDFPEQLPPVPCVFETEDKAFRGFLTGKTEDIIEITLFNEKIEKVSIQVLKGIRMVGLRR